jgi:hypothetical protein
VLALALATGCAGIPSHGAVRVGRELPALGGLGDVDIRVGPPAPLPGMSPTDIVHGFLRAMVNADGDYEIARAYLTSRAAAGWDASSVVTTYDDSGVQVVPAAATGATRTVSLRAPRIGFIDTRGDFTPRAGTVRSTFQLQRQGGEWRIDKLPDGVLLSTLDAQRAFRLADVYYLNRSATTLVPEQVLLQPDPHGVTTALVRALVQGPGPWLAPAVRSAFPPGTDVLGNVPVDPDGIAEVNLSASLRLASAGQLEALSAQLVWTLRQVTEINGVRLLADGSPVAVPGVGVDQPRTAWPSYDPAAPPVLTDAFRAGSGGWQGIGADVPGLGPADGLTGVMLSRDGLRYAGWRLSGLYVGRTGETPTRALTAATFTDPTFDQAGDVFTVATRGARRWVAEITLDGGHRPVAADPALLARPVQELRLSRDGARFAAAIGPLNAARLVVGRVATVHGQLHLGDLRYVLPGVRDVRGVAWDGADQLVVTAANPGGGRELWAVDVDGYGPRTVSTAGLTAAPTDVAAAPGQRLLITAGGSVWLDDPGGGWRRIGRGSQPAYAD